MGLLRALAQPSTPSTREIYINTYRNLPISYNSLLIAILLDNQRVYGEPVPSSDRRRGNRYAEAGAPFLDGVLRLEAPGAGAGQRRRRVLEESTVQPRLHGAGAYLCVGAPRNW